LGKAAIEVSLNFVPAGILGSTRCLKGNVGALHNVSACMESLPWQSCKQSNSATSHAERKAAQALRIKASSEQDTTVDISPAMWILSLTLIYM